MVETHSRPKSNQVNSAWHLSGIPKSSTSFGWGKGGKVTATGLCDPIWYVISRSGKVISAVEVIVVATKRYTIINYLLYTQFCYLYIPGHAY